MAKPADVSLGSKTTDLERGIRDMQLNPSSCAARVLQIGRDSAPYKRTQRAEAL